MLWIKKCALCAHSAPSAVAVRQHLPRARVRINVFFYTIGNEVSYRIKKPRPCKRTRSSFTTRWTTRYNIRLSCAFAWHRQVIWSPGNGRGTVEAYRICLIFGPHDSEGIFGSSYLHRSSTNTGSLKAFGSCLLSSSTSFRYHESLYDGLLPLVKRRFGKSSCTMTTLRYGMQVCVQASMQIPEISCFDCSNSDADMLFCMQIFNFSKNDCLKLSGTSWKSFKFLIFFNMTALIDLRKQSKMPFLLFLTAFIFSETQNEHSNMNFKEIW